jgi:hypothetical protein
VQGIGAGERIDSPPKTRPGYTTLQRVEVWAQRRGPSAVTAAVTGLAFLCALARR